MHRGAVALAIAVISAASAGAQSGDLSVFDRLDLQAQFIMGYLRCTANSFNAERAGVVPPQDSSIHVLCARVGDRMIAALVKTDSSWKRATSLVALDPNLKVRIQEPIDTAEVLVLLRAQRYADWLTWKDSTAGARGLPVVYRADTLIHVWIIPETMLPTPALFAGGLRHFVFPSDAKKELYADPVPPVRPVKRVNGEWLITSAGDSIPTFSEILLAHMLAEDRMGVTIELPARFLKLITSPAMGAWVWLPKKPD
jgi:hypothetical protein